MVLKVSATGRGSTDGWNGCRVTSFPPATMTTTSYDNLTVHCCQSRMLTPPTPIHSVNAWLLVCQQILLLSGMRVSVNERQDVSKKTEEALLGLRTFSRRSSLSKSIGELILSLNGSLKNFNFDWLIKRPLAYQGHRT